MFPISATIIIYHVRDCGFSHDRRLDWKFDYNLVDRTPPWLINKEAAGPPWTSTQMKDPNGFDHTYHLTQHELRCKPGGSVSSYGKLQPSISANYNINIYECVYGFRHTGRQNRELCYSVNELFHLWLVNQKMDGKRGNCSSRYQVIIIQQVHAGYINSPYQTERVPDQY